MQLLAYPPHSTRQGRWVIGWISEWVNSWAKKNSSKINNYNKRINVNQFILHAPPPHTHTFLFLFRVGLSFSIIFKEKNWKRTHRPNTCYGQEKMYEPRLAFVLNWTFNRARDQRPASPLVNWTWSAFLWNICAYVLYKLSLCPICAINYTQLIADIFFWKLIQINAPLARNKPTEVKYPGSRLPVLMSSRGKYKFAPFQNLCFHSWARGFLPSSPGRCFVEKMHRTM